MATTFGATLLQEIQEENLDGLLNALRSSSLSFPPSLPLLPLQEILNSAKGSLDTSVGAQDPDRNPHPVEEEHNDDPTPPTYRYAAPVVEVKSSGSAEGRTQFLYSIVAEALTQSKEKETDGTDPTNSGYSEGLVVWIDCSHRFDIYRLHAILTDRLTASQSSTSSSNQEAANIEAQYLSTLGRLRVFSPWTPAELLVTIRKLESYLLSLQDSEAGKTSVGAIILSDLTSFYWEERQREEEEKAGFRVDDRASDPPAARDTPIINQQTSNTTSSAPKRSPSFTVLSHHSSLTASLSRLSRTFSCPIFISTSSPSPLVFPARESETTESAPHPTLRSPLPSPWGRFINVGIVLRKERKGDKLQRGICLKEAMDMQQTRDEERDKAGNKPEMRGWIDARRWVGACFSEEIEKERLETVARSRFKMVVGDDGVDIVSGG